MSLRLPISRSAATSSTGLFEKGYSDTVVRQTVLIGGNSTGTRDRRAHVYDRSDVALIWITIALAGLAAAAPVGWSIPSLIAPRPSVGKVGGILNFGNQVSGIVAPIVTGYIMRETGSMAKAFAVAAVLLLLGIAAYVFLLGRIEPERTRDVSARCLSIAVYVIVTCLSKIVSTCDGRTFSPTLQVDS